MIRSCSYLKARRAAVLTGLAVVWMAASPRPAWCQWSGTNPVWTNSNVGIGTSSPGKLLDVNGIMRIAAPFGTTFSLASYGLEVFGGGNSNYKIGFDSVSGTKGYIRYNVDTGGTNTWGHIFSAGIPGSQTDLMFIGASGNVGIGTTTPAYKVDVRGGQINASGGYCINGTNCITSWPTGGGGGGTVTSIGTGTGLTGGPITTSGTVSLNLANPNTWTGAQTFTANTSFPSGTWNTSGNVGIGTTSPLNRFNVQANSNASTAAQVEIGPVGISPSSVSLVSKLRFRSTFNNYSGDQGPRVTAQIVGGFGGVWGSEYLAFQVGNGGGSNDGNNDPLEKLRILWNGNVGIGTTNPQYKLAVNGNIGAQDIIVTNTGWSDYVFRPGYRLRPLSEVSAFIQANGHLPEIPTEAEVKDKGVSLGDMQAKLLAKVEELTLHMIQQDKENRELRDQMNQQTKEIQELRERLVRPEKGPTTDSTPAVAK